MVNPLARVVMDNVSKKTGYSKNSKSEKKISNLTSRDENMLKSIIYKDKQVKNHTDRKKMITLDEAANKITGGR